MSRSNCGRCTDTNFVATRNRSHRLSVCRSCVAHSTVDRQVLLRKTSKVGCCRRTHTFERFLFSATYAASAWDTTADSDWDRTRTAFFVGLLGSPDWEIKRKASEHTTVKDINSQFSYASLLHSESDPSGYISLGFLPVDNVRLLVQLVSTANSECFIDWIELLGP